MLILVLFQCLKLFSTRSGGIIIAIKHEIIKYVNIIINVTLAVNMCLFHSK